MKRLEHIRLTFHSFKVWVKLFKCNKMQMIFRFQTLERLWNKSYLIWLKIHMKSKKIKKDLFTFGNSTEHFQTQIWNSLKILKSLSLNRTNRRRMTMKNHQKIKRMAIKICLKRFQSFRFWRRAKTLTKVVSSKSKKLDRIKMRRVTKRRLSKS